MPRRATALGPKAVECLLMFTVIMHDRKVTKLTVPRDFREEARRHP
jgi:hypothetical protein